MGDYTKNLSKNLSKKMNQKQINIEASKCKTIKCKCGYNIFVRGVVLKEVKGILIGNGNNNSISQVDVLYCGKCGTFAEGFENVFLAAIQEPKEEEKELIEQPKGKIISLDTAKI